MLQTFAKFRPDCEKIQNEKNLWYSGLNELKDTSQFNEYMTDANSVYEIQDSFHLFFLKKKIESANSNQNNAERRPSVLVDYRKDNTYDTEFNEIQVIGTGAFGVVCEVKEKTSNEKYAIKMIPIEQNYDQSSIREIDILTKLNYNFVVKCKAIWIEDHFDLYENHKNKKNSSNSTDNQRVERPFLLFIQMELCYKTLKQAIEKVNNELQQSILRKMTPAGYYVACELMIELLEGVDYLHKLVPAVIHRDLKPTNILISFGTNGRFVKIADFGLSTLHENEDQSHSTGLGTARFMAPEVHTKKYDTRCDIFSLGHIIYDVFKFKKYAKQMTFSI
jgi:serine/threonine protein kinase